MAPNEGPQTGRTALSPTLSAAAQAGAADLPHLAGNAAEIPRNHRAEGLERDLSRAHQVILSLRESMHAALERADADDAPGAARVLRVRLTRCD